MCLTKTLFFLLLFSLIFSHESGAAIIRTAKIGKTSKTEKTVALTFDDGPKEKHLDELLTVLREKNVLATFFVLGRDVAQRPELVKKIFDEGHTLANHSLTHEPLGPKTSADAAAELRKCSDLIEEITGTRPRLMRPPSGSYSAETLEACRAESLDMVLWTNNPGDYIGWDSGKILADEVLKFAGRGDIILLHLGIPETVDAVGIIIDGYRKRGMKFVTISPVFSE